MDGLLSRLAAVSLVVAAGCGGSSTSSPGHTGNPYADVGVVGATRVYDVTPPTGPSYVQTTVVVSATATGFVAQNWITGRAVSQTTYEFVNGDQEVAESAVLNPTNLTSVISHNTYTPPEIMHPAAWSPGTVVTTISVVTGSYPDTVTRAVTVNGTESVTVPAGTFSALKTTTTMTYQTDPTNSAVLVYWWAAGKGRVKWTSHPPSDPASVTTSVLTSSSP